MSHDVKSKARLVQECWHGHSPIHISTDSAYEQSIENNLFTIFPTLLLKPWRYLHSNIFLRGPDFHPHWQGQVSNNVVHTNALPSSLAKEVPAATNRTATPKFQVAAHLSRKCYRFYFSSLSLESRTGHQVTAARSPVTNCCSLSFFF